MTKEGAQTSWEDRLAKLKQERDELALKIHLGKKEALAEWEKLEARWNHLKAAKAKPMKQAATQTAHGVGAALEQAERIRRIL